MSEQQKTPPPQRRQFPGFPGFYACFIPYLQQIARDHGYCLAFHGSFATDCDLICIPWVEEAAPAEDLIAALVKRFWFGGETDAKCIPQHGDKPHGRRAWTIHIDGGHATFDVSVMPRIIP